MNENKDVNDKCEQMEFDFEEFHYEPPTLVNRIKNWFKQALQYTAFGNVGNTVDFTEFEYKMVYKIVDLYTKYDNKISSWLFYYINIKEFKLRWNVASNGVGIQGSYNPALWKTMTLSDCGRISNALHAVRLPGDELGVVNKTKMGYRTNIIIAQNFLCQFPVFVHELTHAFQFGLPCTLPADATWKDWLLFKVVMPVGFIFNRLITLFIDNPIVDNVIHGINKLTGKADDYHYNRDKVHLPFLYKFTLEHDVDSEVEDNERLQKFSSKLDTALASYAFFKSHDMNDPFNAPRAAKMTETERQEVMDTGIRQLEYAREDHGEFIDMAIELYNLFYEEAARIVAMDKEAQKNK